MFRKFMMALVGCLITIFSAMGIVKGFGIMLNETGYTYQAPLTGFESSMIIKGGLAITLFVVGVLLMAKVIMHTDREE